MKKLLGKTRIYWWTAFWQAEGYLYWTATCVFVLAIPLAVWHGPWGWPALAGCAVHGVRLAGHALFRPRPQRP